MLTRPPKLTLLFHSLNSHPLRLCPLALGSASSLHPMLYSSKQRDNIKELFGHRGEDQICSVSFGKLFNLPCNLAIFSLLDAILKCQTSKYCFQNGSDLGCDRMLGGRETSGRWGWEGSFLVVGGGGRQCTNFTTAKSLPSTGSATSSRKSAHLRGSGGIESHLDLTSRDVCLSDSGARPGCPISQESKLTLVYPVQSKNTHSLTYSLIHSAGIY